MKSERTAAPDLALQPIALHTLRGKYLQPGESGADDVFRRVAGALADSGAQQERFLETMRSGFHPAGRIAAAAGTQLRTTMINCFVQPITDSMIGCSLDGLPGIMPALAQAAETMRLGGGVGYDFTPIRPQGARVKGTNSAASGPLSYMLTFDRMCATVESAGSRRGAQMAVLRIDHPDIEAFVVSKRLPQRAAADLQRVMETNPGFGYALRSRWCGLSNFNISVAVTDAFMRALQADEMFQLVHEAEPTWNAPTVVGEDGLTRYVYKTVKATELWDLIMRTTYETADPGVLFIDTANRVNNLRYIERLAASNPCGEQILPPYGCCDLGQLNLTRFVRDPFADSASFDLKAMEMAARGGVRILDKVLDKTRWPLPQQQSEAHAKRRIGLGFYGLANVLAMLGQRYGGPEAVATAVQIQTAIRDAAYRESIELAKELGPFPLFEADKYLEPGTFASTLPQDIQDAIRKHGIRNSHLLSIAPTGTLALAFGDNASSGIEPTFERESVRRVRTGAGDATQLWETDDFAWRVLRTVEGAQADPSRIVTVGELTAQDHLNMVAALAPLVDSAISKTINVPADYPFDDFKGIYRKAWEAGLKGITTYRPNTGVGAVLLTKAQAQAEGSAAVGEQESADRRVVIKDVPNILQALKWPNRPDVVAEGVTYPVAYPTAKFAVTVNHWKNGRLHPLEVFVAGNEQPRGLAAIAKALSVDMRTGDPGWLRMKLESLMATEGNDGFDMKDPATGRVVRFGSLTAAFAAIVKHRMEAIGALDGDDDGPMMAALFSRREPKTDASGAMSWHVDVRNPATGDDFLMTTKELVTPQGQVRPYSIWLSGRYPEVLNGLAKVLSIDLRISDPKWAIMKLQKLRTFGELRGDFMAPVPGEQRQQVYSSTVAYIAELLLARMARLGLAEPTTRPDSTGLAAVGAGSLCPACGTMSMHRVAGCLQCVNCGHSGGCG